MNHFMRKIDGKEHLAFVLFFITASLMLIVSVVVSVYIEQMENAVMDSVENHLMSAAIAASTFLTVEELDLFHTIEDIEKPEWEAIKERLRQFAENHQVLYVYYWRYYKKSIQYIIDNDDDIEWMATPELFFNLDDDPETAKAVPHILSGRTWLSDLGEYTTAWEGLISALAPVFNEDGYVYCAAGVDISDEIILNQRRNIRVLRTILICSIFLSLISGMIGMWLYRKKATQSDNANRAKTQYLSYMSHEIRTPLNAIIGIAQIEMQKKGLNIEYANVIEKIYNSGINLLGTINDILDLSKIETGKLEMNPVEYEIASLLNDTIQINSVRIGEKPIKFILDIDEKLPLKFIGDELRIKQILNNLLSNAIKYTEKGFVKLSVNHQIDETDATNQKLCFSVEDTGQGMKPEDTAKLFSEYIRFNVETNRATEGTGIGLNITKNLVGLMEGNIKVESEYGKGSIFSVIIKQKTVTSDIIGAELSHQLRNFTFSSKKDFKNLQIYNELMPNGKVLIVDDVETNLYVAQGLMANYGLQIETAISGFSTIEKIKNGMNYDIIFMDHLMPLMDGIETTQKLRMMGYEGVIVALTANAIVGNEDMFKQNGFDDFMSKPIDVKKLNDILNRFIGFKKIEKDNETIADLPCPPSQGGGNPHCPPSQGRFKRYGACGIARRITSCRLQDTYIKGGCSSVAEISDFHSSVSSTLVSSDSVPKVVPIDNSPNCNLQTTIPKDNIDPMLLDLFKKDVNNAVKTLKDSDDIKLIITSAHAMKTALLHINEYELSEIATSIEKAGLQGEKKFVANHKESFIKSLEKLISEI